MTQPDDVIEFWFGPGDDPYRVADGIMERWFRGGDDFDEQIRRRFGDDLRRATLGEYDDWAESPRGRLALILILDQLSRNLFRGSPRSWSQDLVAQKLTLEGMDDGVDDQLRPIERAFFYMPLQHAEDPHLQEMSVRAFRRLADEAPDDVDYFDDAVDYAERHREVIDRFGRFPHRNEVIGRPTTDEEAEFLEQPNSSF